jgi:serine/threonine protein kinase
MHNIKIVHRDIKPRNCLYSTEHNKFVLADFGISTPIVEDYTQKTYVPYAGTDGYMT